MGEGPQLYEQELARRVEGVLDLRRAFVWRGLVKHQDAKRQVQNVLHA
jgi:hypothetical protein